MNQTRKEINRIIAGLIYFFNRRYVIHYTFNGIVFKTNPVSGLTFVDTLQILAEGEGKISKIENCT